MRRLAPLLAVVSAFVILCACSLTGDRQAERTFFSMDTVMNIQVWGKEAQSAAQAVQERVQQLDAVLSVTDESSQVYALNHSRGQNVAIGEDTTRLLRLARRYGDLTDGALDVTVYPAVQAWGFTTGEYAVPSSERLRELTELVDYRRIVLDEASAEASVPEGMQIDLGALGKGYASDQAAGLLRQRGIGSAILSLGGNVYALGKKPDGSNWVVAVRDPLSEGFLGTLSISDAAVVTSGGYERYFECDGITYWHILDPKTCAPAKSGVLSATVVGDSGVLCDALSTALFVLGPERAEALYRAQGDFEYILVTEEGELILSQGLENAFAVSDSWRDAPLHVVSRL